VVSIRPTRSGEVGRPSPSGRRSYFGVGAIERPIAMNDFPSRAFIGVAGLLALLLLAIGPALDGAGLAEAAGVPALMAAWAAAVVLIDRWVVRRR
jgi:hypothetical protein